MASAKQEAANARARALGFKNAYDRRIKTGISKGKTKSEARGNHPKETKVRKKQPVPTSYHVDGYQSNGKGKTKRHRVFDIPLTEEQGRKVQQLQKKGKEKTVKAYVFGEVYNAPILAGIEEYQEGWDYDLNEPFPGYDLYDFDLSDTDMEEGD